MFKLIKGLIGKFFVFFLLFITVMLSTIFYLAYQSLKPGPFQESKIFYVAPNTTGKQITINLQSEGIINSPILFNFLSKFFFTSSPFKAGEYEIQGAASLLEVIHQLKEGKSIVHSFTVPEGQTVHYILENLKNNNNLTGSLPAIKPKEGWLLADTIHYVRGDTRESVLEKLASEQKKRVEAIWQERDKNLPIKNIEEFVILASIVEKETSVASEYKAVAAVFMNRLKKKMRLQADATVIYGVWGGEGRPSGTPIRLSDLRNDNPYNTYKIFGLPPAAISNPGIPALEAVAHPAKTDALYFVADGSGSHVFAKELREHNRNVKKWRQWVKDNDS